MSQFRVHCNLTHNNLLTTHKNQEKVHYAFQATYDWHFLAVSQSRLLQYSDGFLPISVDDPAYHLCDAKCIFAADKKPKCIGITPFRLPHQLQGCFATYEKRYGKKI